MARSWTGSPAAGGTGDRERAQRDPARL